MKPNPQTIAQMSQYLGLKNLAGQHTELIKRAHEKLIAYQTRGYMILNAENIARPVNSARKALRLHTIVLPQSIIRRWQR